MLIDSLWPNIHEIRDLSRFSTILTYYQEPATKYSRTSPRLCWSCKKLRIFSNTQLGIRSWFWMSSVVVPQLSTGELSSISIIITSRYAIAYGVLTKLCDIGCRTLFSTHYHKLNEEFENDIRIARGHMGCKDDGYFLLNCFSHRFRNNITFLYRLISGPCPKSYGMNVAQLANIPKRIVERADELGGMLETMVSKAKKSKPSLPHGLQEIFIDLMENQSLKR